MEKIKEGNAFGVAGSGESEDIKMEPTGQPSDVVRQRDGVGLLFDGIAVFLDRGEIGASAPLLVAGDFSFELIAGLHDSIGAILQFGDDFGDFLQSMKDIT